MEEIMRMLMSGATEEDVMKEMESRVNQASATLQKNKNQESKRVEAKNKLIDAFVEYFGTIDAECEDKKEVVRDAATASIEEMEKEILPFMKLIDKLNEKHPIPKERRVKVVTPSDDEVIRTFLKRSL